MADVVLAVEHSRLVTGVLGRLRRGERDVVGRRDPQRAGPRLEQAVAVVDERPVGVAGHEERAAGDMCLQVREQQVALGGEPGRPASVARIGADVRERARRADDLERRLQACRCLEREAAPDLEMVALRVALVDDRAVTAE